MPALASLNDIYRVRTSTKDMIQEALELLGVLAEGEEVSAAQISNSLRTLNYMVDSWNTEKLIIWALVRNTFTLTASTNPHELAAGSGVLDAPRPVRIEQGTAFLTGGQLGTSEVELEVLLQDQFEREYDSSLSGIPATLYYEPSMPLAKLWFDVKPDAAYTLVLYLEKMLQQVLVSDVNTQLDLPPGYAKAISNNLAVELGPKYGRQANPAIIVAANEAKARIKRLNMKPINIVFDVELQTMAGGISLADFEAGRF